MIGIVILIALEPKLTLINLTILIALEPKLTLINFNNFDCIKSTLII